MEVYKQPTSLADSEERSRALDPTLSCIVQAPAGSGKTSLLVERFVTLLAQVNEPEAVVAITHTRKAAGEMRARISSMILQQPHSLPQRQRQLVQRLVQHTEQSGIKPRELAARIRVMTIDGLCQVLARSSSYHQLHFAEAGIADRPQVLYRRAVRQLLAALWQEKPDQRLLRVWQHYGCDTGQLETELVNLLGRREQWLESLSPMRQQDSFMRQANATGWKNLARLQQTTLSQLMGDGFVASWQRIAQLTLDWTRTCELSFADVEYCQQVAQKAAPASIDWWLALKAWIAKKGAGTNCDWVYKKMNGLGFPPVKAIAGHDKKAFDGDKAYCQKQLDALLDNQKLLRLLKVLVDGTLPAEQSDLLSDIAHVAVMAVAELYLVFGREQQLDFIQVAQDAVDACAANEEGVAGGIQHLLVDEFQDTSPLQWQLIENLVQGWNQANTLFVVGDPMQSIYGFRQAQVELFMRAQRSGIGTVVLESLKLVSNFRSQPGLVSWVNEAGKKIFAATGYNLLAAQVPFVAATAAAGLDPGSEPLLLQSARARREADLIQLLAQLPSGSSVALLVQKRTLAQPLMGALDQAGIGYNGVEMLTLGEQQHIIDLCNLACLCIEPEQWRHWLGLLRAPQIGAPLALCADLYAGGLPPLTALENYVATANAEADMQQRCQWLLSRITPLLQLCGLRSLTQLAENLWHELGFAALLGEQARQECHNLLQVMQSSAQAHGGWWIDWDEVQQWLNDNSISVMRPQATDGKKLDIQLMTCHKAKGLEFDVVILPYADAVEKLPPQGRPPLSYDQVLIDGMPALLMATSPDKLSQDKHTNYLFLQQLQKDKEEAERRRLLYVAMTRARQVLVVMGEEEKTNNFFSRLLAAGCQPDTGVAATTFAAQESLPQPSPARLVVRTQLTNFQHLAACLPEPHHPLAFAEQGRAALHPNAARLLGQCLHQIMEELHRLAEQADFELATAIDQHRAAWQQQLAWLAPERLQSTQAQLDETLDALAQDPRISWLLEPHPHKRCEWPLVRIVKAQGQTHRQTRVLDLSFCANGYRWIIDYKSMQRESGESDTALEQRARNTYAAQLEEYAQLLAQKSATAVSANFTVASVQEQQLPIKLGIYLLLQRLWVEWDYANT